MGPHRPNLTILNPVFCKKHLSIWIREKPFFLGHQFQFLSRQNWPFLSAFLTFPEMRGGFPKLRGGEGIVIIRVRLHILQVSGNEGRPSILEKWSTKIPDQRQMLFLYDAVFQNWGAPLISGNLASQPPRPKKMPFWGGKTPKKSTNFFWRLLDTYKKYILQKNWSKTVIPALSSGQHNLQTLIGGCHHQLDVSSSGRPTSSSLNKISANSLEV